DRRATHARPAGRQAPLCTGDARLAPSTRPSRARGSGRDETLRVGADARIGVDANKARAPRHARLDHLLALEMARDEIVDRLAAGRLRVLGDRRPAGDL